MIWRSIYRSLILRQRLGEARHFEESTLIASRKLQQLEDVFWFLFDCVCVCVCEERSYVTEPRHNADDNSF
jgi:hypothetical protein